jgi:hypothetical protein
MKLFVVVVMGVSVAMWLALKFWKRRNAPVCSPADPEVNVKAELSATRARGWIFFNLVLENRSRMAISVVDATFSIAGLAAKFQACPPNRETTAKIRCVVKPGEIFPVSLIELFYNAAGKPQGPYSFAVATTIRYRAHGDLFTQVLPLYRVKMIALSPNVLARVRWYDKPANPPEPVLRLPDLEPADLKWLDAEASQAA